MIRTERQLEEQQLPKLDAHILILESRYYDDIGDMLLEGALAVAVARCVSFERFTVPGALELPQALAIAIDERNSSEDGMRLPGAGRPFDGAVALGCVIRGETAHYDIVCNNANHWLMREAMGAGLPIGNAILTVDTREQAVARARGGVNGKGGDAMRACLALIEMRRTMAGAQQ